MEEIEELFEVPLRILNFGGIFQRYEDGYRGTLKRVWTLVVVVSFIWGTVLQTHYIFSEIDDIKTFTQSVSPMTSVVFSAIKVITFYLMNEEYGSLITRLQKVTIEQKVPSAEIRNVNRWERNMIRFFISMGVLSIGAAITQTLIENIRHSNREFPFHRS
jgi:hypothetical protein